MEINRIGVIITNTVCFPSGAAVPTVFNSINTHSREFLFDYSIDDFILKLSITFLKLYITKPTKHIVMHVYDNLKISKPWTRLGHYVLYDNRSWVSRIHFAPLQYKLHNSKNFDFELTTLPERRLPFAQIEFSHLDILPPDSVNRRLYVFRNVWI